MNTFSKSHDNYTCMLLYFSYPNMHTLLYYNIIIIHCHLEVFKLTRALSYIFDVGIIRIASVL